MSDASSASSAASFADLGVPDDLCAVLHRIGIKAPFEIQAATIADALAGRDVLGRAPTGSGKTLAFGIPMIASLAKAKPRRPGAMILSPTRELAEQIRRELEPLARVRGRSLLAIYGGVGFRDQLQGLRQGADLIVACPGRLQDLLNQGEISLDAVTSVVVDEADRMADMGFLPAVRQLLDLTSPTRQTVLFSATLGREVQVLTKNYQQDPVTHEVGEVEPDLSLVDHRFIQTEKSIKVSLAARVISDAGPTVVFCRTRHGVDRVARQLKNAGVKTGWIHGGRSQNQRDSALHAFTTGRVQALVATDVAARGIHVDGVACVIHFDPPEDDKAYVHRSGRTARAGAAGTVVSFINSDQVKDTRKLQKQLSLPADIETSPTDLEPVVSGDRAARPDTARARSTDRDQRARADRPRRDEGRSDRSRQPAESRGPDRGRPDRSPGPKTEGSPSRRGASRVEAEARTSEGGSATEGDEQPTYRDWSPPKKRSKHRGSRPTGKRTGKPRTKGKSGNGAGGSQAGVRSAAKSGAKPSSRSGGSRPGGQSKNS